MKKLNSIFKNVCKPGDVPSEQDAKTRLTQAAIVLFADKGFDGTSTREIAAKAKLNISLISYYFGGKEGLYNAVLEGHAQHAKTEVLKLLSQVDSNSRESFCAFMSNFIGLLVEDKMMNPHFNKIFEREKVQAFSKSMKQFEEVISEIPKEFGRLIQKSQEAGIVKKEIHPETHFCLMIESVSGFMSISKVDCKFSRMILQMPNEKEKLKKLIYSIFVEGILV